MPASSCRSPPNFTNSPDQGYRHQEPEPGSICTPGEADDKYREVQEEYCKHATVPLELRIKQQFRLSFTPRNAVHIIQHGAHQMPGKGRHPPYKHQANQDCGSPLGKWSNHSNKHQNSKCQRKRPPRIGTELGPPTFAIQGVCDVSMDGNHPRWTG